MSWYINKNSRACMIRGKVIEEALRFYLENKDKDLSITSIETYANDLYYLKTKDLPGKIVKFNAKPINSLVKIGIKTFNSLMIKKIINLKSLKIKKNHIKTVVYPDFKVNKLNINDECFKNCCVELKVTNQIKKSLLKKHASQCYNYTINSRKPVILIYLVFSKIGSKHPVFQAKAVLYIVKKK